MYSRYLSLVISSRGNIFSLIALSRGKNNLLSMSKDLSFQSLCQCENIGISEKKSENLEIANGWISVAILNRGDQARDNTWLCIAAKQ